MSHVDRGRVECGRTLRQPRDLQPRWPQLRKATPLTLAAAAGIVLPLVPGERFTLHYYHSVENAPIWEAHSLDETGRIYIEEERYLKFGAGMGRMPGVGRMVRREPYEVIEDMHMPTGDFVLRIGSRGVNHVGVPPERLIVDS